MSLTRTGSGQSLSTAQQDQDLLQELEPHWQSYWTCYTAADLGRMVSRIIDSLGAFAVRQGGEAYNVPYQKRDELQVLKDLIEPELPQPLAKPMLACRYPRHRPAKDQTADVAACSPVLYSRADYLAKRPAALHRPGPKVTTTKKGKVKAESMIACLADYQAMKAKIQLYQETLGLR